MGYPLPDLEAIDGTVCVNLILPNEPNILRAFWGQFFDLSNAWNWSLENADEDRPAALATAAVMRASYAENRDSNIEYECPSDDCEESDEAPYWADADALSEAGTGNNWEYIGDWAVTAFLATAGSPLAAVIYRTLVKRARIAFRTKDLGEIADIFIDGFLALSVDTSSVVGGVAEIIEANIDLVQFAADHGLTGAERIIRIVSRAA